MEQGFHYRLANLFFEKYLLGGERRDLETTLRITEELLKVNPYLVEALWNRAQALLYLGRAEDSVGTLERAVYVEPNFCRGYAKLAQLTRGKDESQSRAWEAQAEKCREAARGRTLEENERWLVEEPEPMSKTVSGRDEDAEPDLPSGFFPSR